MFNAKGPRIGSSWHMRQKSVLGDAGGQLIFKIIIIAHSNISNGKNWTWWFWNGIEMWLLLWNTTIINVKLMQREQSQVNKNNIIIELFFWKKLEKTQKGIFRPNLLAIFGAGEGNLFWQRPFSRPKRNKIKSFCLSKVTFLLLLLLYSFHPVHVATSAF